MPLLPTIRRPAWVIAFLATYLATHPVYAAAQRAAYDLPVLWGKSWLIGYSLLFLCILLGMLAILIPSMRTMLRKKDS
ncbi:MAG: hypothetical protein ACYC6N_00270 [Pirellulaceae bacterium]